MPRLKPSYPRIVNHSLAPTVWLAPTAPGVLRDLTGTSITSAVGGVTYDTGPLGTCVTLDSNLTTGIRVSSNKRYKTPYVSISAWIKPTSFAYYGKVVALDYYATGGWVGPYVAWQLYVSTSGLPSFAVAAGGSLTTADCTSTIATGVWHHLCGTYDGIDVQVFLDGELQGSTAAGSPGSDPIPIAYGTSRDLAVGRDSWYYTPSPQADQFIGSLDDIRIYPRALTEAEIKDMIARPWRTLQEPEAFEYLSSPASQVSPDALSGINSFGTFTATTKHACSPSSLTGSNTFGAFVLSDPSHKTVLPTPIAGSSSVGSPSASYRLTLSPDPLSSGASLGSPAASYRVALAPDPLDDSADTFGTLTISRAAWIYPDPIFSGESEGAFSIDLPNRKTLIPDPIPSADAFDVFSVGLRKRITLASVPSTSSLGTFTVTRHRTITIGTTTAANSFGSVTVSSVALATDVCPCNVVLLDAGPGGLAVGGLGGAVSDTITRGGLALGGAGRAQTVADPADGFAGFWLLQETGTGAANEYRDQTRQARHGQGGSGAAAHTPTRDAGVFCRQAQAFDGRRWISLPVDGIQAWQPLSVSLWARIESTRQPRTFYSRGDSFAFGHTFLNQLLATVTYFGDFGEPVQIHAQGATRLRKSRNYHVAAVWVPGRSLAVYLDGSLDGSVEVDATSTVPQVPGSIGRWNTTQLFEGAISDVRLSAADRSTAWFAAEHANLCSPGFYTVT